MAFDPAALGSKMIVAGTKQISTGGKLQQAAKQIRRFSKVLDAGGQVDTSMASIRAGARSIRTLLAPVVNALQFIRNVLNGIRIPTITFRTARINVPVIGRVRFVTGITLGTVRPFRDVATRVATVRTNIVNIRGALQTIADGLQDLRDELPTAQTSLQSTADEMDTGGSDLIVSGKALKTAGAQLGGS